MQNLSGRVTQGGMVPSPLCRGRKGVPEEPGNSHLALYTQRAVAGHNTREWVGKDLGESPPCADFLCIYPPSPYTIPALHGR